MRGYAVESRVNVAGNLRLPGGPFTLLQLFCVVINVRLIHLNPHVSDKNIYLHFCWLHVFPLINIKFKVRARYSPWDSIREYLSSLRFSENIALPSNSADQWRGSWSGRGLLWVRALIFGKLRWRSIVLEQQFRIGSEALGVVRKWNILRQMVTADPDHESKITRRIIMGRSLFGRQSQDITSSFRSPQEQSI